MNKENVDQKSFINLINKLKEIKENQKDCHDKCCDTFNKIKNRKEISNDVNIINEKNNRENI